MTSPFEQALRELEPEFDLDLDARAVERFELHYDLLLRWNRKLNLTRIVDPIDAARFHFLESAYLVHHLPSPPAALVDVGSGAGFPGVPLACMWPSTPSVLVEPQSRRAVFLRESVRTLELSNVSVVAERFESRHVPPDALLVARALDRFDTLLPPLLDAPAPTIALFSDRELLERGHRLAPSRPFSLVPLPGSDRRYIGLYGPTVPRETGA